MGAMAPDPQEVIDALAEVEQEQTVLHAAENYNLAQDMDEGIIREVAQEVSNGFDDDDESRQPWLDQHTFWLSLYMQQDYAENSDPDRSWGATESLPILTEACDQFQSRTYKTFFPQDTFVSAMPMRKRKENRKEMEERAKRVGDHMSYQLGYKDRDFKPDKDALFLGTAVHGSFFTKAYFSDRLMRPKVDNVRPTDLVVNYTVGPVRIEDLSRKTHIIYTSVGKTQDLVNQGYFTAPAKPSRQEGKSAYNVKVDESMGLQEPGSVKIGRDAPAVLYEQHFYLDLDGGGNYRPYIATICAAGKHLMRLAINWEADPTGNPLKDYEQIEYFTHYKYKNNPDGFYGLGLGHTIGDLNSAVNIMLRQSMDAATLANDGNMSGFASERLGLTGDEIRMVLGKLIKIPDTVGDLTNSIMMMKFPGPNEALISLMDALDQRAQRLGSNTEATTGTPQRAEQATVYLAQIEQALEQFSSVQMRLANSFSDELQKIYKINQRYLPLVDYYIVNDEPEQVTRGDYADDMMLRPIFDPKYATQTQKVARAQAELQLALQNPVNQSRPQVIDEAFRRAYEAMDVDDIEVLVPPQPQIENFDDQLTENLFFLMPAEARPLFDVFPDQDHILHLQQIQEFVAQYGATLQPEQVDTITKHQMKHQAYLYGQQQGIIPTKQIPTPPLAAGAGNEMDSGAAIAAVPPEEAGGLADLFGQPVPVGVGATPDGAAAGVGGDQPFV